MKIQEVKLMGRIPSKKNSKIMVCRGKRPILLPSPKYREWHVDACQQVDAQKIIPLFDVNDIQIDFWLPDNRRCDLTNKAESVMDLLVDTEVLEDDRWQITGPLYLCPKGVDKVSPRAIVWIRHGRKDEDRPEDDTRGSDTRKQY